IIFSDLFAQTSVIAEKGPYKNGTSVFRITTDINDPTIIIGTSWGSINGFWGQVKEKCITEADNDIYSLINIGNRIWTLTIKDYGSFIGDPIGASFADPILGLNVQSSCKPWYNCPEPGRNYFIVLENEPDPCEEVEIEDRHFTTNDPENKNTMDAEYTFRVKGPLNMKHKLWFAVGVEDDLQPANYSIEIEADDLEIISETNCEGIHIYQFTLDKVFGSVMNEGEILNLDYFQYGLTDENNNFIFGPSDNYIYFHKDPCIEPIEEIKINSSASNYLYKDIPLSAYVITAIDNPQLKISLVKIQLKCYQNACHWEKECLLRIV
ncbi:MAG: hypothetical protein LIO93_10705, partial [Bacteroidales bacterium]|nr:hypothetical protein [Bacteroidales bacterium]